MVVVKMSVWRCKALQWCFSVSLNLVSLTRDACPHPFSNLFTELMPLELCCHQGLCCSDGRVIKAMHCVKDVEVPGSRDDGSQLSSGHFAEECGVAGTEVYILQYQASDGCAIGKLFFILFLCCCKACVVDTWREGREIIYNGTRKRICNFILTRYVLYAGDLFRYIGQVMLLSG